MLIQYKLRFSKELDATDQPLLGKTCWQGYTPYFGNREAAKILYAQPSVPRSLIPLKTNVISPENVRSYNHAAPKP